MEYIVIGGDERFEWLARALRKKGRDVGVLFRDGAPGVPVVPPRALAEAERIVMNFPARVSERNSGFWELMARASRSATVYACGPGHPAGEFGDRRVIDLWEDETLLKDNARLTAEGAVAAALRAGTLAMRDTRCLVVGWGRVGRVLAELLVGMGADVTVASRSQAHRNRAVERGARAVDTERLETALAGVRLICNTAPGLVLDRERLRGVDENAMIIDLASPPYGVDLRAAWQRGLRAWREPALPGRCCPESAATAILNAIERSEGRG